MPDPVSPANPAPSAGTEPRGPVRADDGAAREPAHAADHATRTVVRLSREPARAAGHATRAADRTTRALRAVALASTIALVALGLGWELAWAPTGHRTLALKVLPLVAALPGLARHRLYTARWLSLLVWLYVAEGLVRLSDRAPAGALAAAEVALGFVLFTACAAQVRWRLAAVRRDPVPPPVEPGADAGAAH